MRRGNTAVRETMKRTVCIECGREFTQGNAGKRTRCSTCRVKYSNLRKVASYAICKNCACRFKQVREKQVFCDLKCRQEYYANPAPTYNKRCAFIPCSSEFAGHGRQRYCCKEHAYLAGKYPDKRRPEGLEDWLDPTDYDTYKGRTHAKRN